MKLRSVVLWGLLLAFGCTFLGCDIGIQPMRRDAGNLRDGSPDSPDADGDGISDADEGISLNTDTDGDGIPDYQDTDSDGDGIPDSAEAGDDNPSTPPVDSDMDGTPDFRDEDADGNGILDRDETSGDVDGDGIADFADRDDDNDQILDIRELDGAAPVDTDGDGANDYQDPDSDNDTILDGHERDADTDRDGLPDFRDLDSDDDGLTDAQEAGDDDLSTVPVDTDGDGDPDFRDTDSDNDGLSDADEVAIHGTSPTLADTDGDGVDDIIEIAGGTSPTDDSESPLTEGNFVFEVPYMMPASPERDTLNFATAIQFADVYFLFDISGSMNTEIEGLQAAVAGVDGIITNLTCTDTGTPCEGDEECTAGNICSPFSGTCIENPSTSSCVASVWTGAGYYEQCYWHKGDTTCHSSASFDGIRLQPDPAMTAASMATWSTFGGTERLNDAVLAVANPAGSTYDRGCDGPGAGLVGCPAYREEAVRILVAFTDEDSDSGSASASTAGMALADQGITFIGVNSATYSTSSSSAYALTNNALTALANASGSLSGAGAPLVFAGDGGAAVVAAVTSAINEIVEGVPLRVTIDAVDEPGDAGDSLQFIRGLPTNTTSPGCTAVETEDIDSPPDGVGDLFPAVTPGTPVCFDVVAEPNVSVMPELTPLIFEARLTIYGDGSPLDSRRVFFLIRPRIEPPGGPD